MASVEIVAIGTELLLGQLVDTNTAHIAQALAATGLNVYGTHAVGDNRARIASVVRAALDRADGAITSGGLGPTVDDLTKEAVCDVLGLPLELHEPSLRAIEARFAQMGMLMRENNRKQAMMPAGAHVLENPIGSAPGFIAFGSGGKFVASMPGVPVEMKRMLAERLLPWLSDRFALEDAIYTRIIHTIGIGESEIDHRIDDLFRAQENPKVGVLAHDYRADVKLMAKAASREQAEALIAPVQAEIERRLDGHVYGHDGQTLAEAVLDALRRRRLRLAVAESCTGGRVSAALTSVPGSSESFVGGVVAYENSVKTGVLSVNAGKIASEGAVSEAVAKAMAAGVRERLRAQIGLSTTGIAGPGGGTPEKPVGLVWLGLATGDGHAEARRVDIRGDREAVQRRGATAALGMLWKYLRQREPTAAGGS